MKPVEGDEGKVVMAEKDQLETSSVVKDESSIESVTIALSHVNLEAPPLVTESSEDSVSIDDENSAMTSESGSHTESADKDQPEEKEIESIISFFPPAYIQRYNRVRKALETRLATLEDPRTVMEVGCAEFGMHFQFKSVPNLRKVIYLDLDKQLLQNRIFAVDPLPYDYLCPREAPLTFEVYAGCVTQVDTRVKNADPPLFAIVGIEILEHLDKDVEEKFVYTLFKRYAPPLVILTTPNGDFNPVLGLEKGKFRHWDHRFELTRQEFHDWCSMVTENFPEYEFQIEGIAEGPSGSEEFGCLSQIAIFERKKDLLDGPVREFAFKNDAFRVDRVQGSPASVIKDLNYFENQSSDQPYELLHTVEYPWRPKAPLKERVVDEVKFLLNSRVRWNLREDLEEEEVKDVISVDSRSIMETLASKFSDEIHQFDSTELISWLEESGLNVIRTEDSSFHIDVPIPEEQDSYDSEEPEEDSYDAEFQENQSYQPKNIDAPVEDDCWD